MIPPPSRLTGAFYNTIRYFPSLASEGREEISNLAYRFLHGPGRRRPHTLTFGALAAALLDAGLILAQ